MTSQKTRNGSGVWLMGTAMFWCHVWYQTYFAAPRKWWKWDWPFRHNKKEFKITDCSSQVVFKQGEAIQLLTTQFKNGWTRLKSWNSWKVEIAVGFVLLAGKTGNKSLKLIFQLWIYGWRWIRFFSTRGKESPLEKGRFTNFLFSWNCTVWVTE